MSVDQVGSKDSDSDRRARDTHLSGVSVDQVGSKDSDVGAAPLSFLRRYVSVDQVGSKDSDSEAIHTIRETSLCPLIRLVPRTATKATPTLETRNTECPLIRLVPRTATGVIHVAGSTQ